MAATDIVVLGGTTAYNHDVSGVSNVLTSSGFHLGTTNVHRALTGFDPAIHELAVITDADAIRQLKLLDPVYAGATGFAVYPLYNAQEAHSGYLVVRITSGGKILSEVADVLSATEIVKATFMEGVFSFFGTPANQAPYTDPADLHTDIETVKDEVTFVEE
jgi:hypothetical protein